MSQVKIQGNASGTGIFTVAAPNSNTDRTLTLPDGAGTFDRLERAGNVLQVVSATFTTPFSTTSTSYVDVGISLSITPTSATSKILVLSKVPVRQAGYNYASIRWLRGSTTVSEPNTQFETGITISGSDLRAINFYMFLDSPSTTSSTTYKAQAACLTGTTFEAIPSNNQATILLMEIAA